jgi:hypothetical protein
MKWMVQFQENKQNEKGKMGDVDSLQSDVSILPQDDR